MTSGDRVSARAEAVGSCRAATHGECERDGVHGEEPAGESQACDGGAGQDEQRDDEQLGAHGAGRGHRREARRHSELPHARDELGDGRPAAQRRHEGDDEHAEHGRRSDEDNG